MKGRKTGFVLSRGHRSKRDSFRGSCKKPDELRNVQVAKVDIDVWSHICKEVKDGGAQE